MEYKENMDIEKEGGDDIIVQGDGVSYEDAYIMNSHKVLDTQSLVEILSLILGAILKQTDSQYTEPYQSGFNAKSVPAISVRDYLFRIAKCSQCSDECLILALIYIDRIIERNSKFVIKSINIHRYFSLTILFFACAFPRRF